jgi:hypothetical protein
MIELAITRNEEKLIEQVRKLRPFDKLIVAKNQTGSKMTITVIRQDQWGYDVDL